MSSHNVVLCNRAAVASGPVALLAGTYPANLSAYEQNLYDAGGTKSYPLHVRATKAMAGASVVVKCQAAALPIDGACFATRSPSGGQGMCQVWGLTGDLYTIQLAQGTGINSSFSSSITGTAGLDLALVVTLSTGPDGKGNATTASLAAYINGLGANFVALASGDTTGLLGATFDRRFAPRVHWGDVESDIEGTVAVEHTVSATAGSFIDQVMVPVARNVVALRVLARSAAAAVAGDSVQVIAAVEGL